MNLKYIKEHIDDFIFENAMLDAISPEGIAIQVSAVNIEDFLDFVEELGKYFYFIGDPKFGQKFINEDTSKYIYDWLTQILNTGNYEENEIDEGTMFVARFEFFMDYKKLSSFKYALRKYKEKLRQDTKKMSYSRLIAERTAVNMLEIIEKVRLHIED